MMIVDSFMPCSLRNANGVLFLSFPAFVPSLSWQNDHLYAKSGQTPRFLPQSVGYILDCLVAEFNQRGIGLAIRVRDVIVLG
jgi:hypothetical protein